MRLIRGLAVLGLLFGRSARRGAGPYPIRPIRWVVPFPPGGPTDTLSRILAAKLGDVWKPGIVIENKGGAAGAIGTDFAAKAPPDGYTIQLGTQSTNGSNKILYPNLPYDPITDFEPITLTRDGLHGAGDPHQHTGRHGAGAGRVDQEAGWRRLMRQSPGRASTSLPNCWSSAPASRRPSPRSWHAQAHPTYGRPPRLHVRQSTLGVAVGARRPDQGAGADLATRSPSAPTCRP